MSIFFATIFSWYYWFCGWLTPPRFVIKYLSLQQNERGGPSLGFGTFRTFHTQVRRIRRQEAQPEQKICIGGQAPMKPLAAEKWQAICSCQKPLLSNILLLTRQPLYHRSMKKANMEKRHRPTIAYGKSSSFHSPLTPGLGSRTFACGLHNLNSMPLNKGGGLPNFR